MRKKHLDYDLSYTQWEQLIHEWILSARDREILRLWILDDVSLCELAELYKLSEDGVKKIIYKSEKKLFAKAEKALKARDRLLK